MKKKPINYLAYIPFLVLAVSTLGGFIRFQVSAETTKEKVEKLDKKVEDNITETEEDINGIKDDNKELEKKVEVNKTQQDNIQREVQQINDKTSKIYEVLLQLDKKK